MVAWSGAAAAGAPPDAQIRRFCPACACDTEQRALWRKNGSDIFRCAECGLGSAAVADFDPARYYTAEYFNNQTKGGYPDYRASEAVLRSEFRRAVRLVRRIVPAGRLLEIGAAFGFFLSEARKYYDVHG
jgi:hypothetical protein